MAEERGPPSVEPLAILTIHVFNTETVSSYENFLVLSIVSLLKSDLRCRATHVSQTGD